MDKLLVSPPPFRNRVIEPIFLLSREERQRAMERAGFNTFLLKSRGVCIDFLTDSGTSAMSAKQKAAMETGDEAYAGSESFDEMEKAVQEVFGYPYVVPTHQGRGAEHITARSLIGEKFSKLLWRLYWKKECFVPNNLYFTTSRFHQEDAGATWVNVGVKEAGAPFDSFAFKGNIDVRELARFIKGKGAKKIPFVRIEAALNMAGGQPFSLENLRAVSELCHRHGIFLLLDATRISENAWFIKHCEPGYGDWTLAAIVRAICDLTDGCTMSSKKDHYMNIGGFLAARTEELFTKAKELVVVFEGLHTYGGMAGRDMAALAVGIHESVDEEYVGYYVNQVRFLHQNLRELDIPVVEPPGAHGVFVCADKLLPHIPQEQFPAQALAAAIYLEGGVRSMERGVVSGQHGKDPYDGLELVRLAIPRRVYGKEHLEYVAEVMRVVCAKRQNIRGLKMVYEPPSLRFFQARFEQV